MWKLQKILKNGGVALAIWVSACQPAVINSCPVLPVYSKEFSAKLAKELQHIPADHPILLVVEDYIRLRLQLKECQPL